MARLAKLIDGQIIVAHNFVDAPGYSLRVEDAPPPTDGWQYYEDDVEPDDFVLPWKQPTSREDAYAMGAIVTRAGQTWRSVAEANVWEPGVSAWVPATDGVPVWVQPTGAHDAYAKDAIVAHNGKSWRSLVDANTWEPGVSGWRESLLLPPEATPVYPEWVQPTGGHDAYAIGDRVTHNGSVWESTVDSNVWEPGVYGWVQVP